MPDHPYNERIFSPTTAERGWKYFLEGAVSVTGKRGHRYHAEVAGSYHYRVWLELDDAQQLRKGGCDCPVDGACKHMAALWFALQADDVLHAKDELADLLKQKSAEDLRALLLRLAENRETRERLTVLLLPEKGRDMYAAQIKKLFKTPRGGYDYYDAIDLGLAAQEWLQGVALDGDAALEQALPLAMPRLLSALERSDDSEGEIASALGYAIDLLGQVLAQPPYSQKLLDFLDKCLKKPVYFDFGDFGWDLYLLRARIWQEQGAFAAWEKWLDAKLKSSDNEWEQQTCLEYTLDMLEARGQSEAAQQLLAAHLHLVPFRKKALAAAQAEQDWPRMEALLLEGIALAKQKGHYGTLFEWKKNPADGVAAHGQTDRQTGQRIGLRPQV
ncbi:hypothetical protein L1281_002542 [Neisseria sp. HSC-16F19]|nr:hypothetical protein [Neisseria sp. HSC-16F19]MCP2041924.1 hypothetical protein [Neisseria sp. HSC-16F19]